MLKRFIPLALAVAFAVPATLNAQESQGGEERGQLIEVTTWNIDPSSNADWETNVKKLVEAAQESEIPYRWAFWQKGSEYTLVYPVENFAYYDTPMQFMRSFSGKPGEAKMQEAMQAFETIEARVVIQELAEYKADWSYEVEGWTMDGTKAAHMDVMWLKPGSRESFESLTKDWTALVADLDYVYPVDGYEVHFGDVGRVVFVTFVDDLGSYYGENDMAKLVEEKGMGERMQKLIERLDQITYRWDHYDMMFRPDLTYWPPEEGETE